jgi:hypothetical protein
MTVNGSIFPALPAIADTERLCEGRKSRRAWLLSKALEHLPLFEALALAKDAECFLSGDP